MTHPGSSGRTSLGTIGSVSLDSESSSLSSSGSKTSALSVLVGWVNNPVDSGIVSDDGVGWINKDDFIVLHGSILVYPVRVKNSQIGVLSSSLLLGNRLKVSLELQLVNSLMFRFTAYGSLRDWTFPSSSSNTTSNNDITLLGLVSKSVSLIGSGRSVDSGDLVGLSVLPGTDSQEESEDIRLLLSPQLFHILITTHIE